MDDPRAQRFRFHFGRKKTVVEVYLWSVHPNTFERWDNGRWGYFDISEKESVFGELHFVKSRLRLDTIVHEIEHARVEWMWQNGHTITRKNEEKMTSLLDEMVRKFLRELRKIEPKIKL